MYRLLNCKERDTGRVMLDEDVEFDQCPLSETIQETLREFCETLVERIGCEKRESADGGGAERGASTAALLGALDEDEPQSWVDQLAHM